MAITLAEVQKNVPDKMTAGIIDELKRCSFLLANMPFDDAVLPSGLGSALSYGYYRITTNPTVAFRNLNAEYTASNAVKEKKTVDLKPFGGSFSIDRLLAGAGGFVSEVEVQSRQLVKSVETMFNDAVINGDISKDSKAFDGLSKALTGTSTEYNGATADTAIDLSTAANLDANYKDFLDRLDEFLLSLDGRPTCLLGNTKMIAKVRACARRAHLSGEMVDEFGRQTMCYDGIPLIDMGKKPNGSGDIINTTAVSSGSGGLTDLYAVRLGLDGLHGVTLQAQSPVKVWLPDFTTSGAVKKGEVEMIAAVALKSTRAAGVFRKIKVA
ncbi:MAG: phage capsid protein [Clostridiales bacterium]|nr:phage capsid protein [Clostridiales bacterium]